MIVLCGSSHLRSISTVGTNHAQAYEHARPNYKLRLDLSYSLARLMTVGFLQPCRLGNLAVHLVSAIRSSKTAALLQRRRPPRQAMPLPAACAPRLCYLRCRFRLLARETACFVTTHTVGIGGLTFRSACLCSITSILTFVVLRVCDGQAPSPSYPLIPRQP
jgi:hypothetical protein